MENNKTNFNDIMLISGHILTVCIAASYVFSTFHLLGFFYFFDFNYASFLSISDIISDAVFVIPICFISVIIICVTIILDKKADKKADKNNVFAAIFMGLSFLAFVFFVNYHFLGDPFFSETMIYAYIFIAFLVIVLLYNYVLDHKLNFNNKILKHFIYIIVFPLLLSFSSGHMRAQSIYSSFDYVRIKSQNGDVVTGIFVVAFDDFFVSLIDQRTKVALISNDGVVVMVRNFQKFTH